MRILIHFGKLSQLEKSGKFQIRFLVECWQTMGLMFTSNPIIQQTRWNIQGRLGFAPTILANRGSGGGSALCLLFFRDIPIKFEIVPPSSCLRSYRNAELVVRTLLRSRKNQIYICNLAIELVFFLVIPSLSVVVSIFQKLLFSALHQIPQ